MVNWLNYLFLIICYNAQYNPKEKNNQVGELLSMEQKMTHFIKKPKVAKSIFFIGFMVISFGLGVLTHSEAVSRSSEPVVELPRQPIPLALQYKNPTAQNRYDLIPATSPITTETGETPTQSVQPTPVPEDNFVASKNGTKYYPKGCGGIDRINVENRIYFATEKQAQEKGYTRTSTCTE